MIMRRMWSRLLSLLLSLVFLCFILVSVYGNEVTLHEPLINDFPPIKLFPKKNILRQFDNKKCNCIFNFDSRAYPGEVFFHLHIPKTGGTTFAQCLLCLDKDDVYFAAEETKGYSCALTNKTILKKEIESDHKKIISCEIQLRGQLPSFLTHLNMPNMRIITFIREPLNLLFSALMHFRNSRDMTGCKNFRELIETDEDINKSHKCKRYNLHNMQTAALSLNREANISEAVTFVSKNVFHFGITRFYRTSLCLLAYQLGTIVASCGSL